MKTIGYTALHYGADYLGYAIRSIIDHIDEYHVLYVAQGSHGHRTNITCPDSRAELYAIAQQAAGDKLHWHDGEWTQEGQHRDAIHEIVPDADIVLVLDADEIWQWPGWPSRGILEATAKVCSAILIPPIHYWRSFRRAIVRDPAAPSRILFPKNKDEHPRYLAAALDRQDVYPLINHMGYAIIPPLMYYKWQVHGHKGQGKDFAIWFNDVFLKNRQVDCHPIGSEFWNPESVEPLDYMPKWMVEHPYWGKDVIE